MKSLDYKEMQALSPEARSTFLRTIEDGLGGEFRLKSTGGRKNGLPSFKHVQSGIEFKLIPGGEFRMGLSSTEERDACAIQNPPPLTISELRPTKVVKINSFLLSDTPMLVGTARKLFDASLLSPYLESLERNDDAPVYVQRETALFMANHLGCRLPFEREWEYACRASTETLFPWGQTLLDDRELEGWLDFGLPREQWIANHFGLYMLFVGDWCMDEWTPSHEEGVSPASGGFVVKGGGSIFWPWQDQEWIWCMPSMRMPSTDLSSQGCSFRIVRELAGGAAFRK